MHWQHQKTPFLLSSIGKDYSKQEIKEQTQSQSIIFWIKQNLDAMGLKLIVHPNQKAKIGLIPKTEQFTYEEVIEQKTEQKASDRELTLAFIELLQKKCTASELEQIHIPLKVLTKLL